MSAEHARGLRGWHVPTVSGGRGGGKRGGRMCLSDAGSAMKGGRGVCEAVRRSACRQTTLLAARNSEGRIAGVMRVSPIVRPVGIREGGSVIRVAPSEVQRSSWILEVITDVAHCVRAWKLRKLDRSRPYRPTVRRQSAICNVADYGPIEYLRVA